MIFKKDLKYLKCPVCGGKVKIIYKFKDGKTVIVECQNSHYYGTKKVWGEEKPIIKRNEKFLVEL